MRLIPAFCFFLISLKISGQIAIDSISTPFSFQTDPSDVKIRFRCLATAPLSSEPSLIIDGAPVKPEELQGLNPDSIESIFVLKAPISVGLFSCKRNNGVIIVTTKRANSTKFVIKDKQNGSGLAGATIEFVSIGENFDTVRFAANDNGEFATNKLQAGKTYQVTVTSTGYKQLSFHYKAAVTPPEAFLLERNIKECMPVMVQSPGGRTIRCGMYVLIVREKKVIESNPKIYNSVNLYPNPVRRSDILTVEMKEFYPPSIVIRLFNVGGQEIFSEALSKNDKIKRVQIRIDERWPSGIYFIQITGEKMYRVNVNKLIIE